MRRRFAGRVGRPMRGILGGGIPPLLLRANQEMASGNYGPAADGLEQLARTAEGRGGHRAPKLYLEAGRARLLAGQSSAGMALLDRGFRLLAASGAWRRMARASRRIIADLSGSGMQEEAEQVRNLLTALGASSVEIEGENTAPVSRGLLPTHCPGCGAPVHPDETEWLDEETAECEYCGTPMRPG